MPIIVRWPGVTKAGQVRQELVSTIDLLPTALQAAGVTAGNNLPGRDLLPLLGAEKPESWREYIYALTTGSFPRACFIQHSVRDSRYKLISSPLPGTENLDARTYLDPTHPHFVISDATPADQATVSDKVKAAWDVWKTPPHYELYDLQQAPGEWQNLAQDPDHAEVKQRLIEALVDWQTSTRDPFSDPKNVEAYVSEQLANWEMSYRSDEAFRWSYIDSFAKWRRARE